MPRDLLDRQREIAALERQIRIVRAGAGRLIVVEGPAGIGKSSLLGAAVRKTRTAGVRVLRAWAAPLERDAGWAVARQLFSPIRAGPEWPELAVGAAALASRALDPPPQPRSLSGDAAHAGAHGLISLACALAERSPTLLVIDDAHWTDVRSLRWLVRLIHRTAGLPLGVICTVRSGEAPTEPTVFTELLAAAPEPPIRPRPLDAAAVGTVMRERMPAAGPAFAAAAHTATGGNPFLVGALLDHLIAERIDPTDELAASLAAVAPAQVTRSVRAQLGRLPGGADALARAFAVLGGRAPLRHAREVAEIGAVEAARLADHLRAAGLIDGEGANCGLTHPLVAGALYGGMAAGERSLRHARVAALLRRERADPEAVAAHLVHSEPAAEPATVAILRDAACRAELRGAPEGALAFLRRALAEPPADPAVEAEARGELGLMLAAHGQAGAGAYLDGAVRSAVTPAQRARIALAGGRALALDGQIEESIRLCRLGLTHSAEDDNELEAELVGAAWLRASTVAEARERLHNRMADPRRPALWLVHAAWESVCDARPATESRSLLGPAAADDAGSMLETFATLTLIACGEFEAAWADGGATPSGRRLPALAHERALRAMAELHLGRITEAEADARSAFEHASSGWALVPLVDALVELDEPAAADLLLESADPQPDLLTTAMLLERRARLRLAQHRPVEAHDDCLAAALAWRRLGVEHPGIAGWRVDDCAALAALDDIGGARKLAEEHLELAERVGLPGPRGAGLRALAQTGDRSEAIDLLRQSVDLLAETPARLEHTRSLLALGSALRRANCRASAKEPLRKALELADRGGMRRLARLARRELYTAGARPRRAAVSGWDALTAAEQRVAELAAAGWSNPQIAERLYITRRTVETHLTHAFRKLRLETRQELATFFPLRASDGTAAIARDDAGVGPDPGP
ncbi:ATP-binding protein [Actinoplanes sp. CA-142083]|uniref:ATP-binding protein n=1 Tax=Actinoplanes sp. CA-142083 TaxID=3239903 RepID=UPI003D8C6D61